MQTPEQQRVAEMARAAMADAHWNPGDLARATKADKGTIGDFLNFKRWPKLSTQGKIEAALGWKPGEIDRVAREGGEPEEIAATVGGHPDTDEDDLLFLIPGALHGMTAAERAEAVATATAAAYKAIREIKGD